MTRIGPAILGTSRASSRHIVVLFALISAQGILGCATASGTSGKTSGDRPGSAKVSGPRVCEVRVAPLKGAVYQTKWYLDARRRLKAIKGRAQKILDGMTARYRRRYDLDIRAARHLKKERELERLRGSVISEEEYKTRWEKLAALLDADPSLKRAVAEQRSDSMTYRVRKQNALMEATKIALAGRRLEKRLADAAGQLDEHLHDVLRTAVRSVAAHALADRRCDLVCAGGAVVGARRPRRGSCKMRAELDLTGEVITFAVRSLGGKAAHSGAAGTGRSRSLSAPAGSDATSLKRGVPAGGSGGASRP